MRFERFAEAGSSPLTRGKHDVVQVDPPGLGLIPAHAGKTERRCLRQRGDRAHPRSRGENRRTCAVFTPCQGSSPLTRGKRTSGRSAHRSHGLIPAHAGKTPPRRTASRSSGAHPRSRGENVSGPSRARGGVGSSPLTRGKRRRPPAHPQRRGLIPAHAGKTRRRRDPVLPGEAHPRSRGENVNEGLEDAAEGGSSPLTRGKHLAPPSRPASARLIPAHAGKTCPGGASLYVRRAHPRSRGENSHHLGGAEYPEGSSPLTRGKLVPVLPPCDDAGLIPAHAGKTPQGCSRDGCGGAHPRSRGENVRCKRERM